MSVSISVVQGQVMKRLKRMVNDPQFFPAWWKRFGQPIYAQAQQNRWVTEGGSEDSPWAPIDSKYARYKLKKFKDSYGSGTKILIATSRLLASVLPAPFRGGAANPDGAEQYFEITGDHGVIISSRAMAAKGSQPYGRFVNEKRPFTVWGTATRGLFSESFKTYMAQAARNSS